jgi:Fur family transcriptional regulator, ferric uptake regulator
VNSLYPKDFNLKSILREKGYKLTSQREALLDVLEQNNGSHLGIEEIHELVKRSHPEIGIATTYRTLLLFEHMGIVQKLDLDDGYSRYELNSQGMAHRHHHLICLKCGAIYEVKEDLLDTLEQQILYEQGFIVEDHSVKLYGICKDCSVKK